MFFRFKARSAFVLALLVLETRMIPAQGTAPVFQRIVGQASYTLAGRDPAQPGVTTIPVVLVPIALSFDARKTAGKPFVMDAAPDVPLLLRSPVFAKFALPGGGETQYADAMLRATFPNAPGRTLLGQPEVKPAKITVPGGDGYMLTSKKTGRSVAILDIEFVQKELFKQLGKQPGKLVIAITPNSAFYTESDATLCCSWGTHGVNGFHRQFLRARILPERRAKRRGRSRRPAAYPAACRIRERSAARSLSPRTRCPAAR